MSIKGANITYLSMWQEAGMNIQKLLQRITVSSDCGSGTLTISIEAGDTSLHQ